MTKNTVNRRAARGRLVGLGAGAVLIADLPSTFMAAPAGPVDAAFAELVAASHMVDRAADGAAFGEQLLTWVRLAVRLSPELRAEYGYDAGVAIWWEAMERHHVWYCDLHGLDRSDTSWQRA